MTKVFKQVKQRSGASRDEDMAFNNTAICWPCYLLEMCSVSRTVPISTVAQYEAYTSVWSCHRNVTLGCSSVLLDAVLSEATGHSDR